MPRKKDEPPRVPLTRHEPKPKLFSYDETSRILEAIERTIAHSPESSQTHVNAWRDYILIELALTTALREFELTALDIGDIFDHEGHAKKRVYLRVFKGHMRENLKKADIDRQEIRPASSTRERLERFYRVKIAAGQAVTPDAPLFVSRLGKRLSDRTVRYWFGQWKEAANVTKGASFHGLRHTAVTRTYKLFPNDLTRPRNVARHADLRTTSNYIHAMSEEMEETSEHLAAVTHGQRPAASAELADASERLAMAHGSPARGPAVPSSGQALFHGAGSERPAVPSADALILELLRVLSRYAPPVGTDGTGF